jgi:hypothetical protein
MMHGSTMHMSCMPPHHTPNISTWLASCAHLHETEHASHLMCRPMKEHPTDWLLQLPQSTLFDIMQRRCRLLGNINIWVPGIGTFNPLTTKEVMQLETRI